MHKLDKNVDLSFLKEKTLLQVCVGLNILILRFDDDIAISVESMIKLFSNNGEIYQYENFIYIDKEFLGLLGKSIVSVTPDKLGTLTLIFEDESKIEIIDDSDKYESYQITGNRQTIIV